MPWPAASWHSCSPTGGCTRRRCPRRSCWAASVFLATAPWLWFTGYLEHLGEIPPARDLIVLPRDLNLYFFKRVDYLVFFAIMFGLVLLQKVRPTLLPRRVASAIAERRKALVLLLAWLPVSMFLYVLFIPAASFFLNRLTLVMVVPGILLAAEFFALVASLFGTRRQAFEAALFYGLFILVTRRAWISSDVMTPRCPDAFVPITILRELPFSTDTRYFATPNNHLIMTYYTGVPFQSVAPIRRSFLDNYKGPIVLVDQLHRFYEDTDPLGWKGLTAIAAADGVVLDEVEAKEWALRLGGRLVREHEAPYVASVVPPLSPLPAFARQVLEEQCATDDGRLLDRNEKLPVILNEFTLRDWNDWWPLFFYRYVNPRERMGKKLNYARRLRSATMYVSPCLKWAVYDMPEKRP